MIGAISVAEGFQMVFSGGNLCAAMFVMSSFFGSYPREVVFRLKQLLSGLSRMSSPAKFYLVYAL